MKNEIIIDGVTYVRKSYEIGDIYKFSNMDWYIIGKEENKLKLMSKDIIKTMEYSGDNSNDWKKSKVREYLNSFANTLDITKLNDMKTNYDEDMFSDDLVRIPTLREIEALPMNIRAANDWYWTMTASYGVSEDCSSAQVFFVYYDGQLGNASVSDSGIGVRPVILVEV